MPRDYRATFTRTWVGWHGFIESRDVDSAWRIVVPCDEYDSAIWALTLRGAKLKAALWIERTCSPPQREPVVVGGEALMAVLDDDRYASMHP